jgi:hypothetical protein
MSRGNAGINLTIGTDGTFVVWPRATSSVSLFSRDGRFLRTVGRAGDGPGEIRLIGEARLADSTLYVSDLGRGLMIVYSKDGRYLSQHRLPFSEGFTFTIRSPGRAIVGSRSDMPKYAGFPIHEFELRSDSVVRSMGGESGWYSPMPYDQLLLSPPASEGPGDVWVAQLPEFRFTLWDIDTRTAQAVVTANLPWFPIVTQRFEGRAPPPTYMIDFVVDRANRLWILTKHPDPEWQKHVAAVSDGRGGTRVRVSDNDGVWDTQLHVFDLGSGVWVAGPNWDRGSLSLELGSNGEAVLFSHLVDEARFFEGVVLRRLDLTR